MTTKAYQPKTGQPCTCKPGRERDNCARCEGTGQVIDFAAIRAKPSEAMPAGSTLAGRYRTADGNAMIEWEIRQTENGPEFSACGEFDRGCGQCIDSIAEAYPDDAQIQRIARVWEKYHLNGMRAGTPEQTAALEQEKKKVVAQALALPNPERYFWDFKARELNPHTLGAVAGLGDGSYYSWACHVLKARELYRVRIPADTTLRMTGGFDRLPKSEYQAGGAGWFYDYGQGWIYNPIPAEVLAEIANWADFKRGDGKSLGDCQAEEFLRDHGLQCRITLSDSKPANWEPAGHHYRVTVIRERTRGARLVFDFWGSVADANEGKDPSLYCVLNCVGMDLGTPNTFEDFCSEYGESEDSRKALQTFRRAAKHADRLRGFFTTEEVEALQAMR